ncbi:MAG: hypothetical protein ACT4PM_06980 [Gemmatimonadales bacterium]
MRLWKRGSVLLADVVSGSQGGGLYPPLPFGIYSYSLASTISLPDDLTCDITNNGRGRFQAFFDLPATPGLLQSDPRDDWADASLPPCLAGDPGGNSGAPGGTVHYATVCYVLDHYDVWGEYSYTEVVKCWAIAYTTGGEAPQWEI